jgi:hypothetical protein
MNSLKRALIEKAGYDNGFEHVVTSEKTHVMLASARHSVRAVWDMLNNNLLFL